RGTTNDVCVPCGNASSAAPVAGSDALPFSTIALTVNSPAEPGTTPSTTAVTAVPSMTAVNGEPTCTWRTASGDALTDTRSRCGSCTVTSGAPGAAKLPGSTIRRTTIPSKGARSNAYDVTAASSAADARVAA